MKLESDGGPVNERIDWKNLTDTVTEGEQRVLTGYLAAEEGNTFGRSLVLDVTMPKDKSNYRYVDHRSIEWLIVGGVRYEVGKKPPKSKLEL